MAFFSAFTDVDGFKKLNFKWVVLLQECNIISKQRFNTMSTSFYYLHTMVILHEILIECQVYRADIEVLLSLTFAIFQKHMQTILYMKMINSWEKCLITAFSCKYVYRASCPLSVARNSASNLMKLPWKTRDVNFLFFAFWSRDQK